MGWDCLRASFVDLHYKCIFPVTRNSTLGKAAVEQQGETVCDAWSTLGEQLRSDGILSWCFPCLELDQGVNDFRWRRWERVCHMLIGIKVRQIWQSQRHIGQIRLLGKERVTCSIKINREAHQSAATSLLSSGNQALSFLKKSQEQILLKKWQPCMTIQFSCFHMSHIPGLFRIFTTSKIQHSTIARALKFLSKPWTSQSFPASQQKSRRGQKKWKAESRSKRTESIKNEVGAIQNYGQNPPKFALLLRKTTQPLRSVAIFRLPRSPPSSARGAQKTPMKAQTVLCHFLIDWLCVEVPGVLFEWLPMLFRA